MAGILNVAVDDPYGRAECRTFGTAVGLAVLVLIANAATWPRQ